MRIQTLLAAIFGILIVLFPVLSLATGAVTCENGQPCTSKQMQMESDKAQNGLQDSMALAGKTTIWMSDSTGSSCYQIENNTSTMIWVPNLNSSVANAARDFKNLAANDKSCAGKSICVQSVALSNCSTPPNSVNGICGSASGSVFADSTALNAAQLCSSGSASPASATGSGPWSWNCVGANGGSTAFKCSAATILNAVDGLCGPSNGGSFPSSSPPSNQLCAQGTASPVSGGKANQAARAHWEQVINGFVVPANTDGAGQCDNLYEQFCSPVGSIATCRNGSHGSLTFTCWIDPVTYSPWVWTCAGLNGGKTASCKASATAP